MPTKTKTTKASPGRVRVGVTLSPDVMRVLDVLSDSPRFSGNRSKAAAWAILIGAEVLSDASVSEVLFGKPADVLAHYNRTHANASARAEPTV